MLILSRRIFEKVQDTVQVTIDVGHVTILNTPDVIRHEQLLVAIYDIVVQMQC